jgi:hypothetical protein
MKDLSKIDTTIYLGEFAIHQPVTTFTGLLITLLCLFCYGNLKSQAKLNIVVKYWGYFFLCLAFATFLGACSHALFLVKQGIGYKSFWLPMQLLNGLATYYAMLATRWSVLQQSKEHVQVNWDRYSILLLVLHFPSVFLFQNFLVVVVNTALGLIPVMILHFKDAQNNISSKWIANGILISFLTAFIHLAKIAVNEYFNHLDISHILLLVSAYVIYLGAKKTSV